MKDCESYEECLNDPTRDKDMEERCRECNDVSTELLGNPELNIDQTQGEGESLTVEDLHKEEFKAISSILTEVENAINQGDYLHAGELAGTAKWRLDKRVELMFVGFVKNTNSTRIAPVTR